MRDECEAAVEEALGRPLRPGEAKEIEDNVNLHMRLLARQDPQAWMAMSGNDRLQAGAQAAADAMVAELQKKQQRVRLQIAVHDRIENGLVDAFEKMPPPTLFERMWAKVTGTPVEATRHLRVVSQLLAFDAKGKGLTSAETWSHAIANEAFGRLMPLWSSVKGFAHLFENQQGVRDLIHELYGQDTGNAAAKQGAQAWKVVTEELRQRANSAGADIGKLEDWNIPQSHSQARVAIAGLDKWIADLLPLLDRDKYLNADGTRMSDEQLQEQFLPRAFDSIITDGQNKVEPGKGLPGMGSIANRGSAHRAIFFKDAESYLTYQGLYGDRSIWPTLTGHIRGITRDIGLMETLGPNPEQTFRYFNDRTKLDELRMNPEGKSSINKAAAFNEALFDYVAGKQQVVNDQVAAVGQAFRNFQTAAKLGKVVITALSDEAGMAATAFANKVPWSESFMRELSYLNPANAEGRAVAAHDGLGLNSMIGGLNRIGQEDMQIFGGTGKLAALRNFTSKLATGVLQASGAEAMWDNRRRALGSVLMSYLGKTVGEVDHFSDINAQDHGVLANKGVTETDWQVWKRAELEDWGMKHGVLTPKAISAIPDAKIDEAITPQLEGIRGEAQRQVDELNAKIDQQQTWVANRTEKLSSWVDRMKARLNDQALRSNKEVTELRKRLTALYDQLDSSNAYFKLARENQVNLSDLRQAGVTEGRNQAAIDQVASKLRQTMRDTASLKEGLDGSFKEEFAAREQDINRLIESGDERKIAFALDRFNRLFTDANARLTDRLQGADENLTAQINSSVEKVSKLREQIQAADEMWNRANAARPNFGNLREQGVREGRARANVVNLKRQIRELTSGGAQTEGLEDFQQEWDRRRGEFQEYVDRAQQQIDWRQQTADRIQANIEPQIQAARDAARRHASTMLLGHVLEETGMGVMDTGARQRAGALLGTTAGTVAGELTRSALLFKSFALSMMTKHWARAASLPTGGATANYVARIMVAGTVLGALATQLRNLSSGKDPANVAEPRFWAESMLRGGGLGFYGDFLYDVTTSHDTSFIPAIAGPAYSTAEDLWNLTGAAAIKASRGERTDERAKLIRFAKGNIPFLNMWYTQAAMDHLIWNEMQEAASPGYLERMQAKAYSQRGTSWWWEPGENVPSHGPDFAQMWQPDRGREQMSRIAEQLSRDTGQE